jgi:hypothetical protein
MIDVESILTSAEEIITNAASLWKEGALEQRERLQWLLFPEGLKWDNGAFRTPSTCLSYYQLAQVPRGNLRDGVPSEWNFEPLTCSWLQIRGWLDRIQRFVDAA